MLQGSGPGRAPRHETGWVVRVDRGPGALAAADLEELCAATAVPLPAGPVWWRAAVLAEPGWEPLVVRAERGGELLGALPLAVRRGRLVHGVRLAGGPHADHARLPLREPAAAAVLAGALVEALGRRRPWRLALEQLPADDPVVQALAERLALRVRPGTPCPYVDLDHDRALPAQLSRNGKRNRRNARNRLVADGRVVVERWVRDDEVLTLLPALQELRRRRDHALGRASELDDPGGRAFHEQVARGLSARGALEALVTSVDGELAAYVLLARDGDVLRVWCGRVAPGLERYGLGWLSHCAVLEHALADPGVARLDWLRGDQESKQRSATGATDPVVVVGWSSGALGAADRVLARVASSVLVAARQRVAPEDRARWRAALRR